jgi:hypothetical protein
MYNIHFIKGRGDVSEEVVPDEDYYEEHSLESLFTLLSGMVSQDKQEFSIDILRMLLDKKKYSCVVMVRQDDGSDKVFIIPEPERVNLH